ncbi:MAG TPA: PRC-barrel domain-containing protein [Candidatus Sulfotelmatobacter sp.]|nr:PRC-barrel domain-containing protein [Candidatus Sulfotelmatobacter sp.]
MARYGTLGDYRFADTKEAASDIRGSKVYGRNDEELGKIDDVWFDQQTGGIVYLVVDTGGWLSTKKFLVPPEEVRPSLQHENDFLVDLTKQQIESFPPYDGEKLNSEERWADYERRYRAKWETGPVMHRVGTDRNITPTTKQQINAGSGTIASTSSMARENERLAELDHETEVRALHTENSAEVSPNNPAYRWTTFEDVLRRRREDVLQSSIDNAKKAEREGVPLEERRKVS